MKNIFIPLVFATLLGVGDVLRISYTPYFDYTVQLTQVVREDDKLITEWRVENLSNKPLWVGRYNFEISNGDAIPCLTEPENPIQPGYAKTFNLCWTGADANKLFIYYYHSIFSGVNGTWGID